MKSPKKQTSEDKISLYRDICASPVSIQAHIPNLPTEELTEIFQALDEQKIPLPSLTPILKALTLYQFQQILEASDPIPRSLIDASKSPVLQSRLAELTSFLELEAKNNDEWLFEQKSSRKNRRRPIQVSRPGCFQCSPRRKRK